MNYDTKIKRKIANYHPAGGLDNTSRLFLYIASVNHNGTKNHCERVALAAEATALVLGKDPKDAFFAGLLHDIGKLVLPGKLFDGHEINEEEYLLVKTHALKGFNILKGKHLFIALCAGLHHNINGLNTGYGITMQFFPKSWSAPTKKKVLEIAAIVSVCDFIDASLSRSTKIKDGSNANGYGLANMLKTKYPDDSLVIETVLSAYRKLFPK